MNMKRKIAVFCLSLIPLTSALAAQSPEIAAKLGYPQLILHSGKIVLMDDASFESKVGTIVEALAVREDKVLATGSNSEILALAGPSTRQIDLKGRAVLPNFILTHEHPTDWAFQEPQALRHVLGSDDTDVLIMRWLDPDPPNKQFEMFGPIFRQAVEKAKPGQWILLSFNFGPEYEYAYELSQAFPRHITKERLDQLAPNNPVKVKNGFITSVINSRAMEELKKVYPTLQDTVQGGPASEEEIRQFERTGLAFSRPVEPDLIFQGKTALLAQVLKAEMELWAAWGVTTVGSAPYAMNNFQALSLLDRTGQMTTRYAWGFRGPDFHEETLRYVSGLLGHGTDHLWNIGAWGDSAMTCTTIDAPAKVKEREWCSLAPGTIGREVMDRIIRVGGRIATMHSDGDKDIDHFMDSIEQMSAEAGFTLEEIRAKRHAFDHSSKAPRPDQLPRIKKLGMMVSMINTVLWENKGSNDTSFFARDYGMEYAHWAVPRKSVTEAEIMNGFEIDRPLPHKIFFFIHKGMTRYNDAFRKVYGPSERTDRIVQLKALTTWGAHYVLREDIMGSLEPGKFADFMVLDRDYLTIPADDIPNIRVLMTVVGGNTVHLIPSLAREIGAQAVGPVTWERNPLAKFFPSESQ